jgi:hypothetical protein
MCTHISDLRGLEGQDPMTEISEARLRAPASSIGRVEVPIISECLGSGKFALGSGLGDFGLEGMHDDDGTRTKRQIPRLKAKDASS